MTATKRLTQLLTISLLVLWGGAGRAEAGEPPSEPMLRIEAGMHTARINTISIDGNDRYLASASYDKTVRVWDLTIGRLLQTLRPPIGSGFDGQVFAAAISPDGRDVAAAVGYLWDKPNSVGSIFVFDRSNGTITHRIPQSANGAVYLAYSKDGQYLVAGFAMTQGIRVYRTHDYSLAAEDGPYGAQCNGADFDKEGRLVTVSFDGYLRLYDKSFKLVTKAKAPGGQFPTSVSFSPDRTKLAVAFAGPPRIDVLSARDLSFLYAPDISSAKEMFVHVAWSVDGQALYATGNHQDAKGNTLIRKWGGEGRGGFTDYPAATNNITGIRPLSGGGIVYGAMDPAFGVFEANGTRTVFSGSQLADYRGGAVESFLVSDDGSVVQFPYERWGRAQARFSLANRQLELSPQSDSGLSPPLTKAEGFTITEWGQSGKIPKLNGRPFSKVGEGFYSFAISPDREKLILGTWSFIRLFDRDARQIWETPIEREGAYFVNIPRNGQLAVAALANGTIRWYGLRDGKELLAFFPHGDRKRWVLWTPSGYYDASPGAEDLIGWHVNRGKDRAANFFPVSKFRSTYYRPDVLAKVLETLDEGAAVRLANAESGRKATSVSLTQQLPPVVTILAPTEGEPVSQAEITVRFTVRSPSGEPVAGIKVLVDGRPVAVRQDLSVTTKAVPETNLQELRVTIPERDSEIAVLAENRFATSTPAVVRIKWRGAVPAEAFGIKPKLYALAVGISQYQLPDLKLGLAAKDAQDFAAVLQRQQGGLYREVVTKVLTDGKATKDEILDGLEWLQRQTTSKDLAMIFLAGHGVNDPSGLYYFLPVNADPEKLKRTGVAFSDIKNTVSTLAGKTLAFIDTCHSGNIMGARRGVADITAVVNELTSAESGAVVFASSTGKQFSLEDLAWGNGAFTKALVEGLSGKADYTGKGTISINMLDLYLSERVKELTGGKQTPTTTKPQTIPDFPVALKR